MNRTKPTESKRDERGVSETLGVILLFGLLIIALTVVQVNAVPTQNSKVEYAHDQDARTDFQEVRTAIIETAGADEPRSATVDLGVTYPGRLLFLNPGPVNGNLGTVDAGEYLITTEGSDDADLQELCGIDPGVDNLGVPTKALEFDVDYHVYSGDANHRFENTVVHQRSGTNGADVIHNDQQLIRGNTISLYPLVGDVQYSGTAGQSIDFVSAGTSLTTRSFESPWTLSVPTALSSATWNESEELLSGELGRDDPNVLAVSDGGDGLVDVRMAAGSYNFRCTIVGVNETPDGVTPVDDTGGDADDDGEINPVVDDALTYVRADVADDDTVTVTWRNGGTRDITMSAVRVPFYNADSQGNSGGAAAQAGTFDGHALTVGGEYVDLPTGPAYVVDANGGTIQVTMAFSCADGDPFVPGVGDYYAVALETEVGSTTDRHNYFVTPLGGSSGNFNRCGSAPVVTAGLSAPDVSEIDADQGSETQSLSVRLDGVLAAGETITIDASAVLSDGFIDYPDDDASLTVADGSGTVGRTSEGVFTYTAGSSDTDGATITISISNIVTQATTRHENYGVSFERSDSGGVATVDFRLKK